MLRDAKNYLMEKRKELTFYYAVNFPVETAHLRLKAVCCFLSSHIKSPSFDDVQAFLRTLGEVRERLMDVLEDLRKTTNKTTTKN